MRNHLTAYVLIAAAVSLVGCSRDDPQLAQAQTQVEQPPTPVPVAMVERRSIPMYNDHIGNAEASQAVDIRPRVSGFIVERHYEEGRYVDESDLLYTIDPEPFQAQLDAARGDLEAEEANLAQLEREVERFRSLVERGGISRNDLDDAMAQANQSRGRISALKAAVHQAEIDLEYTKVTAPFGGRMERTRVYRGDLVTEQESVLSRIVQLDPVRVVFNISRVESFRVQKLQREGRTSSNPEDYQVQAFMADGTPYEHPGKIDFVSADIDPLTDSFTVRAVFPNPDISLLPGQYTEVRVVFGTEPDQLLVPEAALSQGQDGYFVYVVGEGNQIEYRKVLLGKIYQGKRVIRSGVDANEQVVIEGLQTIRPGVVVDPQSSQTQEQS